jgi:hypothetical protein
MLPLMARLAALALVARLALLAPGWLGWLGWLPKGQFRGGALSSAILYLAIVAIWAVVLVPRWLRPAVVRTVDTRDAREARQREEGHDDTAPWPDSDSDTEPIPTVRPEHDHLVHRPARPAHGARRGMIIQARRRMLVMITILAAGAVAMAATHLAAWWVVIPPGTMLGGFILLLREAARSDAARARRFAAPARAARPVRQEAAESVVAAEVAPVPVAEPEPTWSAEIIDISARLNDELYDQYADAAVRAVGD